MAESVVVLLPCVSGTNPHDTGPKRVTKRRSKPMKTKVRQELQVTREVQVASNVNAVTKRQRVVKMLTPPIPCPALGTLSGQLGAHSEGECIVINEESDKRGKMS